MMIVMKKKKSNPKKLPMARKHKLFNKKSKNLMMKMRKRKMKMMKKKKKIRMHNQHNPLKNNNQLKIKQLLKLHQIPILKLL